MRVHPDFALRGPEGDRDGDAWSQVLDLSCRVSHLDLTTAKSEGTLAPRVPSDFALAHHAGRRRAEALDWGMLTRVRPAGATAVTGTAGTGAAVTGAVVTRAAVPRAAVTGAARPSRRRHRPCGTTLTFITWAALCSAGCARGTPDRATSSKVPALTVDVVPPTATGPTRSPSAGSDPTTSTTGRARSTVDQAVARCERALDRAVALSAGDAFAALTAGCADLFSRAPCRDAFRNAASAPVERRGATLAKACADAYCPALSPPTPALCARRDALPPPSELAPMWGELHERILVEELGEPRAETLVDRQQLLGRPRQLQGDTPECHHACCGPNQQGPAPDGTYECCLCDPP